MKVLIASDIHGSEKYAEILFSIYEQQKPDFVVLLGDLLYHGPRNDLPEGYNPKQVITILNQMSSKVVDVRGNCDSEVDQMVLNFPLLADYSILLLDGIKVFATHGHIYNKEQACPFWQGGVLLCGHTHIGAQQQEDGYVYINPGSLSIPKDGHNSYMLYENKEFIRYATTGEVLGRWHFL